SYRRYHRVNTNDSVFSNRCQQGACIRRQFCYLPRSISRRDHDQFGPEPTMNIGHLAANKLNSEDLVAISQGLTRVVDQLALLVTPPRAAYRLTGDHRADAGQFGIRFE